jgi:hypothetical protein
MQQNEDPPKTLNELMDRLDRIREELMMIQKSMEKLAPPDKRAKKS